MLYSGAPMLLENLNVQLFHLINAPITASPLDIHFGIFMANDTLYLLIFSLLIAWFLGRYSTKALVLKAVVTTVIALLIGYLVSLIYPHPRPFVVETGQTLIAHAATASFPSNHMLIFSSIALCYLFAKQVKLGLALLVLAIMVAWARIYVGVHFPFDMLGALIIAFLTNLMIQQLWPRFQQPIMDVALKIYHYFFAFLLNKGIIR